LNDSEDETCEMLGSPSPSEEEEAIVSRLSQEGGVSFLSFLVSKAVPVREEKEPKEWTYKDMIGLPAGQLEEWRAACQREIEILTKQHIFDMVVRPSGCRVIKNRWVFDVKPDGRKRAHLVAKGFSQGTRTKIPTRHMLDTLGVQTTSDSNVPSGQKLGLLKMYP